MIHTVKGFGIVNKAEIDVFLELSCFFDDSAKLLNDANFISVSSGVTKKIPLLLAIVKNLQKFFHGIKVKLSGFYFV